MDVAAVAAVVVAGYTRTQPPLRSCRRRRHLGVTPTSVKGSRMLLPLLVVTRWMAPIPMDDFFRSMKEGWPVGVRTKGYTHNGFAVGVLATPGYSSEIKGVGITEGNVATL